MELLNLLDHPSREFTPIPFWFLNGDLTHEEIRRQLQDFHDHGVYGVVLHPRIGLPRRIGYLSPDFFSYIRTAVETAKGLDMQIVLYDEGMYPSGSANGQVVQGYPELASQGIALTDEVRQEDKVLAYVAGGAKERLRSHAGHGDRDRGMRQSGAGGAKDCPPEGTYLNLISWCRRDALA